VIRLYFSKKEQYAIVILLLGVLVAVVLLSYAYTHRSSRKQQATFFVPAANQDTVTDTRQPLSQPIATADDSRNNLVVHVAGAVKHPGIVTLPTGARVNDALQKAGGSTQNGYPDALNLAAKVVDGEKISVPTKAEWDKANSSGTAPPLVQLDTGGDTSDTATSSTGSPSSSTGHRSRADGAAGNSAVKKSSPTGKVSLNSATSAQLMSLPGIGQVTAQRIIDYRTAHGRFKDINELRNIPRMGEKSLAKIAPYLTL